MPAKSHKGLSVLYVISAILLGLLLWAIWSWGGDGFGGDLEWAVITGVFIILLLVSAIECWFARTARNTFQSILVWAPISLIGLALLITILNGVING